MSKAKALSTKERAEKILRVNRTGVSSHITRAPVTKRKVKHFGEGHTPRTPEPGEALPREYTTLKDSGTYKPDAMVSHRPGAEDFLQIKSSGEST